MSTDQNYQLTKEILLSISKHLSTREKYRNTQLKVVIKNKPESSEVILLPNVTVFPNVHKRKDEDRIDLLEHVFKDHIRSQSNVFPGRVVCSSKLVEGEYEFGFFSKSKKKRSWVKISSL